MGRAFQAGNGAAIQVSGPISLMTTANAGAVLCFASMSCAWAGLRGAQQIAQMVNFFKETGIQLAPQFYAANHHHFMNGLGVVAIIAGIVIIVGGIIDIVQATEERDALVERTEKLGRELCEMLDELSNLQQVAVYL